MEVLMMDQEATFALQNVENMQQYSHNQLTEYTRSTTERLIHLAEAQSYRFRATSLRLMQTQRREGAVPKS